MTTKRQREIVIEFERVQLIRKRAHTTIVNCSKCNSDVDCVTASLAAELFDIELGEFLGFVTRFGVHHEHGPTGTAICVPSLLAEMQQRHDKGTKLILDSASHGLDEIGRIY
ncbi:MAG: hypothetical protein KA956_00850 [Pyrinomonadaceae bacterium]|nr:hypothetical protein [Acidobacteriota bacterium]MBK7932786.1 hypothetical protein [Acidobacteriota bacterium]MBP7375001.1 hypothetical protein [Pyrinomonadaceae bacterium]MBP7475744.1 hypothetical protein [Pyrinomonadaceae bacterium]